MSNAVITYCIRLKTRFLNLVLEDIGNNGAEKKHLKASVDSRWHSLHLTLGGIFSSREIKESTFSLKDPIKSAQRRNVAEKQQQKTQLKTETARQLFFIIFSTERSACDGRWMPRYLH